MARRQKLHPAQKRLILDYAGVMSIRQQPKKVTELDKMVLLFRTESPDEFKAAYDVIINRKVPSGDNSALVAAKVTEIVEKNISIQESNSIDKMMNVFLRKTEESSEKIKEEARREIAKARSEFITHRIQIGSKKAKVIDGVVPRQFDRLLQLGQMRKNTLMVGPAGCGKTFIARKIAESLDLKFMSQSCSEGISESTFTGRLLPVGERGKFVYRTSQFVRMYEEGGVFLLDEIDGSDPNVLVFLNQAENSMTSAYMQMKEFAKAA